jgi:hypothetical protein
MSHTKHHTGIRNDPRHISELLHLETKFQMLPSIFEVKLFNSANADFLSRELYTGNQYGDGQNASFIGIPVC